MTRMSVPAKGWRVEIVHSSGTPHRPEVAGEPAVKPTANDYPRLDIPVQANEKWLDSGFEDAEATVYRDGKLQPIDRLVTVEPTSSATYTLNLKGGSELESRVRRSVDIQAVPDVVNDVLSEVSYVANVDEPPTEVTTEQVSSGDTKPDWDAQFAASDPYSPIISLDSLSTGGRRGRHTRSDSVLDRGRDTTTRSTNGVVSDAEASNGEAISISAVGQYLEKNFDFDGQFTMPEPGVTAAARYRYPNSPDDGSIYDVPELLFYVNGNFIGGTPQATSDGPSYQWQSFTSWSNGDLSGSNNTLRVEIGETTNDQTVYLDGIVLFDSRWHDARQFTNTTDSNDALPEPTPYPAGATGKPTPVRPFDDVNRVRAVVGGEISTTVNDVSGITKLGLSNDGGDTWADSAAGVSSFATDFASPSRTIRWRVGLQGYGSQTSTPTQGVERPEMDTWTLDADLEDVPLVVDQEFDNSVMSILQSIADDTGDFLFEYRIAQDGTESVEWTQPGQRTTDRQDPVSRFEQTKKTEPMVEKLVVKGRSRSVTGESFTANHGQWTSLENDEIGRGSETVTDPNSDTVFEADVDYEIALLDGEIKTLSDGSMSDGATYEISYDHKPKGEWTSDSAGSDPETEVRTLPQLATSRACKQIARLIGEQVNEPLIEGTVQIPSDQASWSVVQAVDYDQLAISGPHEVRSVNQTPLGATLRLGTRQRLDTIFGNIRSKLQDVSDAT